MPTCRSRDGGKWRRRPSVSRRDRVAVRAGATVRPDPAPVYPRPVGVNVERSAERRKGALQLASGPHLHRRTGLPGLALPRSDLGDRPPEPDALRARQSDHDHHPDLPRTDDGGRRLWGCSHRPWSGASASRVLRPVSAMPQPGDPYANAFVAEVSQCWRMVHGYKGQAAHCAQPTTFTGRWYSPKYDGTYRRVWACADHLEGLVAITELGWARRWNGSPILTILVAPGQPILGPFVIDVVAGLVVALLLVGWAWCLFRDGAASSEAVLRYPRIQLRRGLSLTLMGSAVLCYRRG